MVSLDAPSHFPLAESFETTSARLELGRHLFYDTRLSVNGTRSCGICHEQAKAFSDGLVQSLGVHNDPIPFNSIALFNLAWKTELTWNKQIEEVSIHMEIPLFSTNPVEMGMTDALLEERLQRSEMYVDLFTEAFPEESEPLTTSNTIQAIADFSNSIVSGDSPYDRWLLGEADLETDVLEGLTLFQELGCGACHGGVFFDQPDPERTGIEGRHGYFNTGLYNLEDTGSYPIAAQGLYETTREMEDMGKFRVPTLRNLTYTYPWMHDGSEISLKHIIESYARGGRQITSGPNQGDGRLNPYKSELIDGFEITDTEIDQLILFLESLNDDTLIQDTRWKNPFCIERQGIIINEPCTPPFEMD
jgi:cytochrome c peroxidase